jgi:phage-related protein
MAKKTYPRRKATKIKLSDVSQHTAISQQSANVDMAIKAKPKGWRIKGSEPETYRRPTISEIKRGYATINGEKRKVYKETRRNRSDLRDKSKYRFL